MNLSLRDPNHCTRKPEGIVLERIQHLPVGGKMGDLPPHLQHKSFIRKGKKKTGGPNLRIIRLENDKPSLTVTAYVYNKFVHPEADRYITPREAACLQDFPDDYIFQGAIGSVRQQIGNAVPAKLGMALGNEICRSLHLQGYSGEVPVASYFCGAGGLDLGLESSVFKDLRLTTKFCTDIDKDSCLTIPHNRPDWNPHQCDIRKLSSDDVVAFCGEKPVVIVGGPPCQSFSVAGKQRGTQDPLGQLYRDFVRHIDEIRPSVVLMENVYGLAQVKASNTLSEIYEAFEQIGYSLNHFEVTAADFGTPQKRRRLIFFGVPKSLLSHMPRIPEATNAPEGDMFLPPYAGAGQAISHLPEPHYL